MKKYLFLLLLATSCINVTSTTSPLQGVDGYANGQVSFVLKHDPLNDSNIVATAYSSDGEQFTGNIIQNTETSTGVKWGTQVYNSKERKELRKQGNAAVTNEVFSIEPITTYSSSANGLLIGNRGRSMTCSFTLNDPEMGLIVEGGIGNCQLSDGKNIPVNIQGSGGLAWH